MLRVPPILAVAASVAPAAAQGFRPYHAPVRDGGTFHVLSGAWAPSSAPGGAFVDGLSDVVYRNDAFSGHFNTTGMGHLNVDAGVLPTSDNGTPFSVGADRVGYEITAFEFSYCTDGPDLAQAFTFTFYESFLPCSDPVNPQDPSHAVLVATVPASGLPGSPDGSVHCYTITVDLTGAEFCLRGDGGPSNPGWDDDLDLDSFGWGYQSTGPATLVGAVMAGDPDYTPGILGRGSGTYYHLPNEDVNTGFGSEDRWWTADPTLPGGPGCYDFGGYANPSGPATPQDVPYASFALVLHASQIDCDDPPIGSSYCTPTIPNSIGLPSRISATGSLVAALNDVTLHATQLPANQFGYFLAAQGQAQVFNPGNSQGILCLGGGIGRYNAFVGNSGPAGRLDLVIDLTAIPTNPPLAVAAGETWYFQCWHRDNNPLPTSNFTDGLALPFN